MTNFLKITLNFLLEKCFSNHVICPISQVHTLTSHHKSVVFFRFNLFFTFSNKYVRKHHLGHLLRGYILLTGTVDGHAEGTY